MDKRCECPAAGWCQRHHLYKNNTAWKLCQNDEQQRAFWDKTTEARQKPMPSIAKQMFNFANALVQHAADKFEMRTEEEIAKIAIICENCPGKMFDGTRCRACGCPTTSGKQSLAKKMAWRSSHCPMEYW